MTPDADTERVWLRRHSVHQAGPRGRDDRGQSGLHPGLGPGQASGLEPSCRGFGRGRAGCRVRSRQRDAPLVDRQRRFCRIRRIRTGRGLGRTREFGCSDRRDPVRPRHRPAVPGREVQQHRALDRRPRQGRTLRRARGTGSPARRHSGLHPAAQGDARPRRRGEREPCSADVLLPAEAERTYRLQDSENDERDAEHPPQHRDVHR